MPGQRLTQRSLHSVHSRLSWTAANRSMTLVCNLGAKGRLPRSMFHLESVHSDFPPLGVFFVLTPAPGSLTDASLIVPRCRESDGVRREMHQGGADVEASSVLSIGNPRDYLAPNRDVTLKRVILCHSRLILTNLTSRKARLEMLNLYKSLLL